MRMTRNLDKDRGFVNGALGTVVDALNDERTIFTVRLTTDAMILVHPVHPHGAPFVGERWQDLQGRQVNHDEQHSNESVSLSLPFCYSANDFVNSARCSMAVMMTTLANASGDLA